MSSDAGGSRPARDAWVEIRKELTDVLKRRRSRPARDAWVEIGLHPIERRRKLLSRPARDAWVEIKNADNERCSRVVASRKGRVGRNQKCCQRKM